MFHGNLGVSITLSSPVSTILKGAVPWTVGLIGISTLLSFLLGTLVGALLGWTRGSRMDSLIPAATFFQAVPYFFLGTVMLLIFGSDLHWFPELGAYSLSVHPSWTWAFISSALRYGELPMISIVLSSMAGWMLGMRNMMITMVAEDFVLMSVAMGLASPQGDQDGGPQRHPAEHREPFARHWSRCLGGVAGRTRLQLSRSG